jgi:alginate O-acetyltransferase complex protein AlgI
MPFNSLKYFIFLPFVYLVFNVVGDRVRWCVLLAASLLFYATLKVPYLLVTLSLVAVVTYCFGILLDRAQSDKAKRIIVWCGVACNVLILALLKYLPFLFENLERLLALLQLETTIEPAELFVTIGVSYFIFQAISYLFDVYLEIEKPERHFGYFALYLAFFPKLLQGPIERAGDLIPQLRAKYEFNYDNLRFGLLLFAWGLFKKVVIANRLSLYVDSVYGDVHAFSGLPLLLATYAYALQIYMDFSGYTDMALGSARLFNINLTQNFNSPYLATSMADFWRRWHISFSRWILDYLFKPLQMQLRNWKNPGTAMALFIAFLLSGLWHGASWGFIVWGGMHGVFLASSVFYKPLQKKVHKYLGIGKSPLLRLWQIFVTFNLTSFAWIFFRAPNLESALYVVRNLTNYQGYLATFHRVGPREFLTSHVLVNTSPSNVVCIILSLCIVLLVYLKRRWPLFEKPLWVRWPIYYGLLLSIMFWGLFSYSSFIYFKF